MGNRSFMEEHETIQENGVKRTGGKGKDRVRTDKKNTRDRKRE